MSLLLFAPTVIRRAGRIGSAGEIAALAAARERRLLDFAREIDREGDRPAALGLLEELSRSSPDFAAARKQMAEWRKPAAKGQ